MGGEAYLRTGKFPLVQFELDRHDWSKYRDIRASLPGGIVSSAYIPETVLGFLNSASEDELMTWYWKIENHAVVQGGTYEVAEHLIPVLVAATVELDDVFVRAWVLELIYQMVAYYPSEGEDLNLTERCRMQARGGLWRFYFLLVYGDDSEQDLLLDIIKVIDPDMNRVSSIETLVAARG